MNSSKRQAGFTLLELMIALTIGIILIAGTVTMMRNSSGALKTNETNADMVSAIRLARNNLRTGVQMAGYFGRTRYPGDIAGRKNDDNPLASLSSGDCSAGFYIDLQTPIYVIDGSVSNPYASTCFNGRDQRANTDALVVRYAVDRGTTSTSLAASSLYIYGNPTGGELFIGGTPPSFGSLPAGTFKPEIGKKIYDLVTEIYYVKDTTGTDDDGLYRLTLTGATGTPYTDELISTDITDMQIQLGVEKCDATAELGPDICEGSVEEYVDGTYFTSTTASTSVYERAARLRTVSIGITALSDQIIGASSMNTLTHRLRSQAVSAPSPAIFQAMTYHIRNSEDIF